MERLKENFLMIRKSYNISNSFSWLTLIDNKPDCNKFEVSWDHLGDDIDVYQKVLNLIFKSDIQKLVVGPCVPGFSWNDFANVYYEPENFVKPTLIHPEFDNIYEINFMNMMVDNNIEYDYCGYCKINKWDDFIQLVLNVILNVGGTDSLKFYNKDDQYCFYIHYTCSIGIYYKVINESIKNILKVCEELKLKVIQKY